uniref:Uncharacterized protein n=1 Tax=Rhizophagus irregularis (strain DAOM 181602 / DAOM 197198 / MUCL 43194) TaxID=747089 RepID=U9U814_RHIID
MLENIISEWIRCISEYYRINRDGNYEFVVPGINNQLKNDMLEFVEADKTLMQEQANTSIIQYHLQAYYTSRKLTEILVQEETQGLDSLYLKILPSKFHPGSGPEELRSDLKSGRRLGRLAEILPISTSIRVDLSVITFYKDGPLII